MEASHEHTFWQAITGHARSRQRKVAQHGTRGGFIKCHVRDADRTLLLFRPGVPFEVIVERFISTMKLSTSSISSRWRIVTANCQCLIARTRALVVSRLPRCEFGETL